MSRYHDNIRTIELHTILHNSCWSMFNFMNSDRRARLKVIYICSSSVPLFSLLWIVPFLIKMWYSLVYRMHHHQLLATDVLNLTQDFISKRMLLGICQWHFPDQIICATWYWRSRFGWVINTPLQYSIKYSNLNTCKHLTT